MTDSRSTNPSGNGPAGRVAAPRQSKGLKDSAIGFWEGLSIGLDSTAPAYSIAAVLGSVVVIAGVQAPAVLWVSFVPMFLIAGAFLYMNRADTDCGTTFSWVTRAMGPWFGWMGGWAVFTTGVLVIGSLADVAAKYLYVLVGLDDWAESRPRVMILAIIIVLVMTWLCVVGTEASAKVQVVLVFAQVAALVVFIVVGVIRLANGSLPEGSVAPSWDWLNPVGLSATQLTSGLLVGVFIYWGWESAVNLSEESRDGDTAPGRAGMWSTVILVATYLGVGIITIAVAGVDFVTGYEDETLFGALGDLVLGPLSFILLLSIITSGIASTQTTILPASRVSLSMAAAGAFPKIFATINPKYGTPGFGTWFIGLVAIGWYVGASIISDNFLFDSISALSLLIAFYYALTGLACVIYWRHRLFTSVKAFLFIGLGPLIGALILGYLLVESVIQLADPEESYSGSAVLGLGVPLAIALFFVVLGVVLMVAWRFTPAGRVFFSRRGFERVSDEVALAALGPVRPGAGVRG
ncbi:APC family permease [Nakamurella sp. A5-74]|uniref:APC family permease n=1 Tax=Nakamurella sp. A5-74 TaxID=3158264 RepID=A0AAU8DQ32_9ACTN